MNLDKILADNIVTSQLLEKARRLIEKEGKYATSLEIATKSTGLDNDISNEWHTVPYRPSSEGPLEPEHFPWEASEIRQPNLMPYIPKKEKQEIKPYNIAEAIDRLKELQIDLGKTDIDEYRNIVLDWHEDSSRESEILKRFREYDLLREGVTDQLRNGNVYSSEHGIDDDNKIIQMSKPSTESKRINSSDFTWMHEMRQSNPSEYNKIINDWYKDENTTLKKVSTPTKPSDNLTDFLIEYETFEAKPYRGQDSQNRTVGYGHVITPADGTKYDNGITEAEARELLEKDIEAHISYLNNWLSANSVVLSQNQYDALASFTFNAGPDWITKYHGLRDILLGENADYDNMHTEFMDWIYSGGEKSLGLYRRRMDELRIFFDGDYSRNYPDWE